MHEMQAAILRVKLKHLDEFNNRRRRIARLYGELLEGVEIPSFDEGSVYHLYVVRSKERDKLMEKLKGKDINTLIHYPMPIHLQEVFKDKEKFSNYFLYAAISNILIVTILTYHPSNSSPSKVLYRKSPPTNQQYVESL
mgnify:CR=1 FL=1